MKKIEIMLMVSNCCNAMIAPRDMMGFALFSCIMCQKTVNNKEDGSPNNYRLVKIDAKEMNKIG